VTLRFLFSRPAALLGVSVALFGCAHSVPDAAGGSDLERRFGDFTFCEVPLTKQSSQKSCGAAALHSVLRYWLGESAKPEPVLRREYPAESPLGYPLLQLKTMAETEGLLAFAVGMDRDPIRQVLDHVLAGRPVIAALEVPKGRYFGAPLPVIETVDRRTVSVAGLGGDRTKAHYVVVLGVSPAQDRVLLMDPQYGYVDTSVTDFGVFWKAMGYPALVCSERPAGLERR
jgi:hypothetical protein